VATFDPSSREASARAEIDATSIGPRVRTLLVGAFLATLAVGPLWELAAVLRGASRLVAPLPAAADSGGGLAGELARWRATIAELETRWDERTALVRGVRPWAQQFFTAGLGYGNERVLVGRDGWLFYRNDFEQVVSHAPAVGPGGRITSVIVDFRDQLAERGIRLLLVPVPVKPTIHAERLSGQRSSRPVRRRGEEDLLADLAARGVEVLDLAAQLARDAQLAPIYLATDTHWRPEVVEIAAREIALRLRATVELPSGEPERFRDEASLVYAPGDMVQMLELPAATRHFPDERVQPRTVLTDPGTLIDGPGAPVLLLGDSFAGIYGGDRWGVAAGLRHRLAYELGLPVAFIAQAGGGASRTRTSLADRLARDPEFLAGVRAVVWEFAARELSQGDWRIVELP